MQFAMTMYRDQMAAQQQMQAQKKKVQTGKRNWLVAFLLAAFLGPLGIHRFYTGYTLIGVLQLLSFGGCGIWLLIDYVMLAFNKYNDADGCALDDYNGLVAMIFLGLTVIGTIVVLSARG